MTVTDDVGVYYDPYDVDINADPYPTYARLRDEAPLYVNEKFGFWALSRHEDVEKALLDWQTFSNTRSDILDIILAGVDLPGGVILFEDPPLHTMHRKLMSRVFTPKRMAALEDQIREFCVQCLDPFVGSDGFDVSLELGDVMPMKTIGMLLGIPEEDQVSVREKNYGDLRTKPGEPIKVDKKKVASGDIFAEYVEWRSKHPSDDLMTQLLNSEFEDETGETRKLTRDEVLVYTNVIAGAGNETTGRLIGWLAKLLAEHPDQRRDVVEDLSLVPQVVDEAMRFEPTGPHVARYVARDVELHGQVVPAGSAILLIVGSANRDERHYERPDVFDIHRPDASHLTLGFGLHYCLGANLAKLEGRVALEELLKRFPEWDLDREGMALEPTSTVRGWARLPIVLP